jgi:hypothetical protein
MSISEDRMVEIYAVAAESKNANASLDEERSELRESVMRVMAGKTQDPEELAACSYLLEHLSRTMGRPLG